MLKGQGTGKCVAHPIPNSNVWLIDTPGFDDTFRNDGEILEEINRCLSECFHKKAKVTGVLYIHAITEPRMRGSAMKNLRMFKEIVGPENMRHCYLVTTKWSKQPVSVSEDREVELKTNKNFWKPLLMGGAQMVRFEDSLQSAWRIIDPLARSSSFLFKLTQEFDVEKKKLDQTTSGKMANEELEKAKAAFRKEMDELRQDHQDAMERKDKEMLDLIEDEQRKVQGQIEDMKRGQEAMNKKAEDDRLALEKTLREHQEIRAKDKTMMKNRAMRWGARVGVGALALGVTVASGGAAVGVAAVAMARLEVALQTQKENE